jgi:hypothetical protein
LNLELNRITEKIGNSPFVKNFIKELSEYLENANRKNEGKSEEMDDSKLTPEEDMELYKRRWDFLENYFEKELSDLSNGEVFIVTDKCENDHEYHRYKVAQYKNKIEHKCVVFERDLPENVQVGDVVRKIDGKYIGDEQATRYVNDSINAIKREIINNR